MDNSRRFRGRYIGTLAGAVLSLILCLVPHTPYSFSKALAISLLPLIFGFLGNYMQRKYFPENRNKTEIFSKGTTI